jgi:hypothetical protein
MIFDAVTMSLIASQQASPPRPIPRLSAPAVSAIQNLAKNKRFYDFVGLSEYDHGRLKLLVTSNRAIIAYKTAAAAERNRSYTPPAQERLDTVNIECGDSDLLEIFECSRVRVMGPDKSEIQPLMYSSRPTDHTNTSGDRWTVHEVRAVYSVEELSDGFLVEYASYDGTEWTFEVSPDDAQEKLLLKLAEEPVRPAII